MAAGVPLTGYLELTSRCNLRCGFCCNRKDHDAAPLDLEDWCRVARELRDLGTLFVTLTGGEPLVHPAFFEIAGTVRRLGMAVRVLTNGTLVDASIARRLAALSPLSVEMSLHGSCAASHDRATGVAGSFDRLMAAIRHLGTLDVPLALKTPVTRSSLNEVEQIIDLAANLSVSLRLDTQLTLRDDGDPGPLDHALDPSESARVVELLARRGVPVPSARRVAGGTNCGLGRSTVSVAADGEVYPCVLWRQSAYGNVRRSSLPDLWRSPLRGRLAALSDRVNQRALELGDPWSRRVLCPARCHEVDGDSRDLRIEAMIAQPVGSPALRRAGVD